MKGRSKKVSILILLLVFSGIVLAGLGEVFADNSVFDPFILNAEYQISKSSAESIPNTLDGQYEKTGICYKVVDGDTIWVTGVGKIRFVGVNTPERGEPGYHEAKDYVKEQCLGKPVGLDIDDAKHYDKYNRTLAVIYTDNGTNLNQALLHENLAEIMYIPPSEFNPYSWQ
jgi:micrococcal nuclease